MKRFFEFYQQISQEKLLREDTFGKPDPIPLSQMNADVAKASMTSGLKDGNPQDDALQAKKFNEIGRAHV